MRGRSLREAVLAAVPILRAVAVAVCGRVEQADDLVQEALAKAWTDIDLVPAGNEYGGLVVYIPAQSTWIRLSQTAARDCGQGADLHGVATGADRSARIQGDLAGAQRLIPIRGVRDSRGIPKSAAK
jgi:DNA-directed RNA polymerase specialized sigma24 family protein